MRGLLTYCVGIDDFILWVDVDVASFVLPGFHGEEQQVELGVANLGHFGEVHPHECGGQCLRHDEFVTRVKVLPFPLWQGAP